MKGQETRYEQVASVVKNQIQTGILKIGDKIPSVRKMCKIQKMSPSTIIQAYILLEEQGLIEARPQSGFYVKSPISEFLPEPTPASPPKGICKEISPECLVSNLFESARNKSIIPLGAACPSPDLFPNLQLNRLLQAKVREIPFHSSEYDFPPGTDLLRQQISKRSLSIGAHFRAQEIVVTNGCMEALNLSLRAVAQPGDTIAVESPTYFGILQAIESLKMRVIEIPSHPRSGIDLQILNDSLKKTRISACVVVPNFNNPLGSLMPDSNKKELVTLLTSRGIPIIEDDLYGDLAFNGCRPKPIQAFDSSGLVLLCSSFSKTLAPGYRIGWVVPGKFYKQVERLKSIYSIATPSLPPLVLAEYLQNGGYDRHIRKLRNSFSIHIQRVTHSIHENFPEGVKVSRPEGGFVLWVELPKAIDTTELHLIALKNKISISPGVIFSASGHFRNYMRINCGHHWSPRMEQAFVTLGKLIRSMI